MKRRSSRCAIACRFRLEFALLMLAPGGIEEAPPRSSTLELLIDTIDT
jgi:hypothetical protein